MPTFHLVNFVIKIIMPRWMEQLTIEDLNEAKARVPGILAGKAEMENIRPFNWMHIRNLENLLIRKEVDVVRGVDSLGHAINLVRNYDRSFR